jgi:hypothetical protein
MFEDIISLHGVFLAGLEHVLHGFADYVFDKDVQQEKRTAEIVANVNYDPVEIVLGRVVVD